VVISRLYYNKGIDLLVAVIPRICAIHPRARFIIAGDGPKFLALEEMREKYMLQDRVEMLGSIRHEEVRNVCPQFPSHVPFPFHFSPSGRELIIRSWFEGIFIYIQA